MQDLVQRASLSVILPKDKANYKGNTQTWVIIGNVHCHALPSRRSLLYTTLHIA